jgi:hypothetical protein
VPTVVLGIEPRDDAIIDRTQAFGVEEPSAMVLRTVA